MIAKNWNSAYQHAFRILNVLEINEPTHKIVDRSGQVFHVITRITDSDGHEYSDIWYTLDAQDNPAFSMIFEAVKSRVRYEYN